MPSDAALHDHLSRAVQATEYETAKAELEAALDELKNVEASHRSALELVVWMDFSVIADHFDDFKTAIEYNEKLALRKPDDPFSHLALARLYGELGNQEKAAESLRKCGELAERCNDKKVLAALAAKGHLPDDPDARAVRLADAVAGYREALADRSLGDKPERYAGTQQALGGLYRAQADLLTGAARTAKLQEAADAYRETLKVYTPEGYPEENRAFREKLVDVEKLLTHGS